MKERVSDVTEALKATASGDYNVTSIRQISMSSGVPKTSVCRILHCCDEQAWEQWPWTRWDELNENDNNDTNNKLNENAMTN